MWRDTEVSACSNVRLVHSHYGGPQILPFFLTYFFFFRGYKYALNFDRFYSFPPLVLSQLKLHAAPTSKCTYSGIYTSDIANDGRI